MSIVPATDSFIEEKIDDFETLESTDWLKKKSLISKSIKNYKSVIDCIVNIMSENIPSHLQDKIQLSETFFYINSDHAPVIKDILSEFAQKYKLNIQKDLAQILYVYELKSYAEVVKEINGHIKLITDFLNQLHGDLSLILNSEYSSPKVITNN
ncbi:hypothetical protein K5I29_03975 [Flavobacterium agricola]|uniref:Uncharacterized protein n=1 Tax=Flavobacterium agricola TaxID=2870839 RepID=A0ABY6M0P4_9FLAO|nr:hypothetical protein [Flavobacterium agricola]UYW02069.1 hypothetical protein K5I29_03975 [Flavobacterium agricola]